MKIRIYQKQSNGLFYFQFYTDDGQVILDSQGYQNKDGRDTGVESVKRNAGIPERYTLKEEGGKYYFTLKAGNNEEIARSPLFDEESAAREAMNLLFAKAGGKGTLPGGTLAKDYSGKKGDDNYRSLALYERNTGDVDEGFATFSTDDNHHFFAFKQDGKVILLSEAYKTASGRDNGLESVKKNMREPKRYQREVHSNGKYYFNLLAGNNQEIATSRWFEGEADRDQAIRLLLGGGGGVAAPKKKKRKKRKRTAPKGEKVYLKGGDYHFNDVTYQTMKSANGKYYFTFKDPDGKTILLNASPQGFVTEEDVDGAIQSVLKYAPHENNYTTKTTKNGKYYFYLNDDKGRSIGRSFFFNTPEETQAAIALLLGDLTVAGQAPASGKNETKMNDEYLPCGDYAGREWFHKFFRKDKGEYYFAFNSPDGKTYLRSEGYTNEKGRDNGIESVMKNAPIDERWVTGTEDGKYYYALKAGNHQEIARSCNYATEAEMKAALAWVRGEESILGPGAQYIDGKWWTAAMLRMKKEQEAAKLAAAAPKKQAAKIDDYLPCSDYAGEAWFHTFFREDRKEYYFAFNGPNGKTTYLRSEGYTTQAARDNGIESVRKNAPVDARWVTGTAMDGKYHYYALKAANHQEIARSCYYGSEAEMKAALAWVRGDESILGAGAKMINGKWWTAAMLRRKAQEEEAKRQAEAEAKRKAEEAARLKAEAEAKRKAEEAARLKAKEEKAALAAAAALAAKKAAATPKDKEDDYLPCKEYQGHTINDKQNNIAFFKHKNGQYYFVIYDKNGEVRLRSEGFPTAKGRDQEVSGALRFLNDKSKYKRIERGDYYMDVLYDETGREVGRSCLKKKKVAAAPVAGAAAAAATAATVAAAAKKPEPVVTHTETVKEVKKGGFGWLWWLLIPLLLFLAWYFLRGCDGCNKKQPVAPVTENVEETTPAVDTQEVQVAPPVEEEEVQEPKVIEEKPVIEEEEDVTPAVGVEAGFDRINEHK